MSLDGAEIPAKYPTLHKSHFYIGLDQQQYHATRYSSEFVQRPTQHVSTGAGVVSNMSWIIMTMTM